MTNVELDTRPEVERLRERVEELAVLWRSALGAVRILGREVRSLRAEVEALRGEPK